MEKSDKTIFVYENWISIAESYGLGRGAIEYMRPAFQIK